MYLLRLKAIMHILLFQTKVPFISPNLILISLSQNIISNSDARPIP